MEKQVLVYVHLGGVPQLVGRLWTRVRKNKESATFEYGAVWLRNPGRFSLEPALTLGPGPFHTTAETAMFGAIGDSAPDRWGRSLMRRIERRRAEREGQAPRTLREIDYLLLVNDEARVGALRFAEREGGPFLQQEAANRVPPLVQLPKLLSATERVIEEAETEEDLRLLFAPGSYGSELNLVSRYNEHDEIKPLSASPCAANKQILAKPRRTFLQSAPKYLSVPPCLRG